MINAPGHAGEVGHEAQIMRLLVGRQQGEDYQVGMRVGHAILGEAKAQRITVPGEVLHDVQGADRHVVDHP